MAKLFSIPTYKDPRGSLSVIEKILPFDIKRVYYIYDVDNYDVETSHVLPAMLRKFHEAKENNKSEVILWGTGNPKREFLHVDDLARAVVFSIENPLSDSLYNIGTLKEVLN